MNIGETIMKIPGSQHLAIYAVATVTWGAWGVLDSLDETAHSRAAAITTQACYEAYRSGKPSETVTQGTIDCMRNGWVSDGKGIDTDQFSAGEPVALLKGYIELKKSKGQHFDVAKPVYRALIGGPLGWSIIMAIENIRADRKNKSDPKLREDDDERQSQEPPKGDNNTTSLWTRD